MAAGRRWFARFAAKVIVPSDTVKSRSVGSFRGGCCSRAAVNEGGIEKKTPGLTQQPGASGYLPTGTGTGELGLSGWLRLNMGTAEASATPVAAPWVICYSMWWVV